MLKREIYLSAAVFCIDAILPGILHFRIKVQDEGKIGNVPMMILISGSPVTWKTDATC